MSSVCVSEYMYVHLCENIHVYTHMCACVSCLYHVYAFMCVKQRNGKWSWKHRVRLGKLHMDMSHRTRVHSVAFEGLGAN